MRTCDYSSFKLKCCATVSTQPDKGKVKSGGVKIRDELILTCNRGDFPANREKNRELSPFSMRFPYPHV